MAGRVEKVAVEIEDYAQQAADASTRILELAALAKSFGEG